MDERPIFSSLCVGGPVRRAAACALAVAMLGGLVPGRTAHARPDALPFETAIVLHGCADAPFGADRLVEGLETVFAREPVTPIAGRAAPIRVWFRAPRCGATDRRVQVAIEVIDASVPRIVLAIAPTGATPQARSLHLAREAHAVLTRVWPAVTAAAIGNPYVVDVPIAFDANPYRARVSRPSAYGAPLEALPPNPYRR